jgi:dipeptidyl aminopeptidase/acylaminoacyl peptidase
MPVRLTQGPLSFRDPALSPDGKTLFVAGNQKLTEVTRYDLASRTFQPFFSGIPATEIDISRDGEWATYTAMPAAPTFWRSRMDGGERLRLNVPPGALEVHEPRWSPDGKRIAFMAQFPGNRLKLCLVSSDGSSPELLIPDMSSQEGVATWSKDGNQIVFGEPLNYRSDISEMTIHVLDLKRWRLSTLPGSEGLWSARWSPDGRYIAALPLKKMPAGDWYSTELRLFNTASASWKTLAHIDYIEDPAWSRDSKYIYFHTLGDDPRVYRARASGGQTEPLISLNSLPGSKGKWTGVAPEGSPLILHDVFVNEVYALNIEWP